MANPAPGERILVPTEVKDGPFPSERMVTVNTAAGPITGFAKADFVIRQNDGTYLLAEVKRVSPAILTVKLFGSFFTTTGIADIPRSGTAPLRKAAAG